MTDQGTEAGAILIAEDEAMLRIVAVETLRDDGFTVYEAGDGADALAALEAHPDVRLLISDVKMPRLGGYELAERALSLMPGLKVVFMTGYSQDAPPSNLEKSGFTTLHKPFELTRLSIVAREMLGKPAGTSLPSQGGPEI